MSNTKEKPISEYIGEFCKFCEETIQAYDYNYEEINRLDKMTQDFLHALELSETHYKDRAKIATQLSHCRQERRRAKDFIEDAENIVRFLRHENGASFVNMLRIVLGNTRKAEEYHKTRTYKFRILRESYDTQK